MSETMSNTPENRLAGCSLLNQVSARPCQARIECTEQTDLFDAARALYARCTAHAPVSRAETDALFAAFGSALTYRCCIGNALYRAQTDH